MPRQWRDRRHSKIEATIRSQESGESIAPLASELLFLSGDGASSYITLTVQCMST